MEFQDPTLLLFWLICMVLALCFIMALAGPGESEPIHQPPPRDPADENPMGYKPPPR